MLLSIEKMSMVTLAGPLDKVDTTIQNFVVNREFHPENAVSLIGADLQLERLEGADPYAEGVETARRLASALGVTLCFEDFASQKLSPEDAFSKINALNTQVAALTKEREEQAHRADECDAIAADIAPFISVDEKLVNLLNVKYVKFRYGRIATVEYAYCLDEIRQRDDAFVIDTGQSGDWTYMMYFALPSTVADVDALTASRGFTRIHLPDSLRTAGTAAEVSQRMTQDAAQARAQAEALTSQLSALKEQVSQDLLKSYSCLRFYSESFSLRSFAAQRKGRFYLVGWVPSREEDAYVAECERSEDFSCFSAEAQEVDFTVPPTKLQHRSLLGRIFEPYLGLYGQPAYNELDPTLFMAVTYMLLFGIMFGDVGQGICLALIGLFIRLKMKNWLGGIITCCGLSGAIFGFVYGSFFGNEELMPWGFKILKTGNVSTLLLFSVGLGAVLIAAVMGLNIYNGVRQRDWKKVFFSGNGVAGFLFYYGFIAAALCKLALKVSLFHLWYVLPVILLPLLCIMLQEPIGLLLKRGRNGERVKFSSFFATGFFEMFETVLSYLTNTLSFLRVGAYAITHVGLMLVIQFIAGSHQNPIVIVIGNIFVIGFEGLLVGIQVLRLEFYELFGRFHQSGGKKFHPSMIDYDK